MSSYGIDELIIPQIRSYLVGNRHDDIMEWRHSWYYWVFAGGIHQCPVDSPDKEPVMSSLDVIFVVNLNKQLNKQSRCQ